MGPYPPPYGGVAAHVERLAAAIEQRSFSVRVLNHSRTRQSAPLVLADLHRNPVRYWRELRRRRARLIHYHHSRWSTLIATAAAVGGRDGERSVITLHSHSVSRYLTGPARFVAPLTRWALNRFDVVIAVSDEVAGAVAPGVRGRPLAVIPAYVRPPTGARATELSADVKAFMEPADCVLVLGAYRLTIDGGGRMVYGLDFGLDVFVSLASEHPRLRMAVFLALPPRTRAERRRLDGLHDRAGARGVADRFRVYVGEPLPQAFSYDSILLRPSVTDGDAVAVREALDAGRPVIASDVVRRPDGATALPLDRETWRAQILAWLAAPAHVPVRPRPDSVGEVIAVYRSLLAA